jgi:hypothetical protein
VAFLAAGTGKVTIALLLIFPIPIHHAHTGHTILIPTQQFMYVINMPRVLGNPTFFFVARSLKSFIKWCIAIKEVGVPTNKDNN